MYQNIITDKNNHIFTITINREDKMNALNILTLQEIKKAVLEVQNLNEIKGIIITGKGTKAFAAGADISEFANFTEEEGTNMSYEGHQVMNTIENSSKPVIAAVNGFALGGGCELAMACHLRVASSNAKMGQPEVNLGVPPGYGGTQRLVQLVGKGKALEMLLTTDIIKAEEALTLGLVNHVVTIDQLIPKCNEILNKVATKSPSGIKKCIKSVNYYFKNLEMGMNQEIEEFGNSFQTKEFIEGTSAFLEKRNPNWD